MKQLTSNLGCTTPRAELVRYLSLEVQLGSQLLPILTAGSL